MGPAGVVRLLEGAPLVGTQGAVHGATRRLQAAATQPLALGDVRHAVALLVHRQVAHVAEQDHVAVLALAVVADAADGVLVDQGAGVRLGVKGGGRSELDEFCSNSSVQMCLCFLRYVTLLWLSK